MRPTQINIIGKSKHVFQRDVYVELRETSRFRDVIQKVDPSATITLSDRISSVADLDSLIHYLVQCGIPRGEIRVRNEASASQQALRVILNDAVTEGRLSFGADVAEHDAGLARYFITTDSYLALVELRKHLVIGPKGSGKSAMLKGLSTDLPNCLVITPEHYATDILEALGKNPISTQASAYITTWKYTLLIEIFRRLVENARGDSNALAELRKYLLDHGHMGGNLSLFERFAAYLRRITKIRAKIGPAEGELGVETTGELEKLFKMDELFNLLPAMRRILRDTPFVVFIDELDQSWNNTDTSNTFLVSLLTAAIQLRGYDPNLHVIVFLRSEIVDLIKPQVTQLDKLRSDIESIQWSNRELTKMIVSRAFDSMQVDPDVKASSAISMLFPEVIGHSNTPSFEYILSRTSLRPREVIQFCNLALRVAHQLQLSSVLPEAVIRAEEEFSAWKLEHIIAENLYIYPQLDYVLERFRGRSRTFQASAIDSILTDILLEADAQADSPVWLRTGLEPSKLLGLLYKLEVIGIERPASEGFDFVFSRPKGRTEQSSSFQFHPALWRALDLI